MSGVATPAELASTPGALVARAAGGDRVAFARIVEAHHGDMARVAYVVSGDAQLAEDAVQAAWSIAWRKLRSLRDPERLRPWLMSVAANEARQMVRRKRRIAVAEIDVASLAASVPDPSDAIDRLDLVNAISHLKPEDRALLALRYVVELESGEIGPLVGMSPSGVRGHLSRVLGRLRRELRDG
ncbi:MAG: sigma-70 family RNA polymerase sigma factor [Chloroflexi bacterium]|jgi:RNA polymerase sigma-70 factor (ECF subfamily)|nr:sigma-70 family RNA polymerase sigma factor [Chloroflexota bacterium]